MVSNLQHKTETALAKIESFDAQDLDFLGQKWPKMTAGHKALFYFLLGGANLLAQPAWAAMAMIFVPVSCAFASGSMAFYMLLKAFEEDEDRHCVDVEAEEVDSDSVLEGSRIGPSTKLNAIETEVEPVYEPNPWAAKPRIKPYLGEQPEQEVYADPLDKARATGVSVQQVLSDDEIKKWGTAVGQTLVDGIDRPQNTVFEESSKHQPFNIAAYLAANPQPMMITAPPRTGKGIIVAQLIREFKQRNPGSVVWVLQPKYHPNEWGYWSAADRVWGDMIEDYQGKPGEVSRITQEWEKFIHDWRALPQRPKLLVVDEGVKISAVAKRWFKDFLVSTVKTEASSGETDDRYLAYITQSALVSDIGMSSGDRSCLSVVCLANPAKKQHLKSFLSSYQGEIAEPGSELYSASQSPKQAIVYCSALDEWHPLPEYPVYQSPDPHPQNVAGKPKVAANNGLGEGFTEPNPWGQRNQQAIDTGWDFDGDEPDIVAEINYPEIEGKIEQLKQSEDPRYLCAAEFLEELINLGDKKVVATSEISKTAWASRWDGKDGGIRDRKAETLDPFIKNAKKFGFLQAIDSKYMVILK